MAAGRTLWVFMEAWLSSYASAHNSAVTCPRSLVFLGAFSIGVLVYWLSFHSSQCLLALLLGFSLVCNPAQWSRELYLQCPTCTYQLLSLLCKVRVSVSCAERITLMNRAVSPSHVRQKVLLVETSHARVLVQSSAPIQGATVISSGLTATSDVDRKEVPQGCTLSRLCYETTSSREFHFRSLVQLFALERAAAHVMIRSVCRGGLMDNSCFSARRMPRTQRQVTGCITSSSSLWTYAETSHNTLMCKKLAFNQWRWTMEGTSELHELDSPVISVLLRASEAQDA